MMLPSEEYLLQKGESETAPTTVCVFWGRSALEANECFQLTSLHLLYFIMCTLGK